MRIRRAIRQTFGALAATIAASVLAPGLAQAQTVTFSVDSPATLGGTAVSTNQTIQHTGGGAYALAFDGSANGLEEAASIDALVLLTGGEFLFSSDMPFTPAGTTYMPRDIVRFKAVGATYSLELDGGALGLEESANIDALGLDALGRLLVSFEAPETVGGVIYAPNDVALVDGGSLSPLFVGDVVGIPAEANVTGYEQDGGGQLLRFDVPLELGGTSIGRGDIARLAGGAWSLYFDDAAFPEETAGLDFSVPCLGPAYAGVLQASKTVGTTTKISWTPGGSARFDLVRGALETLRSTGGDFTAALDAILPGSDVCMANDAAAFDVTDTRPDPNPGRGYIYVLRAVAGCGAGGGYDEGGAQVGSRDSEIAAAAAECP